MKIILTYDYWDPKAEQLLIEWLEEKINDKSPSNTSPLRYVDDMEIEK